LKREGGELVEMILRMISLLFIVLVIFTGCGSIKKEFTYMDGDIECEVSWVRDNVNFRAIILKRIAGELENISVSFCEPRSLEGVTVESVGNEITIKYGDMEIENSNFQNMIEVKKFFEYDSKILSSSLEEKNKGTIDKVMLQRADGEKFFVCFDDGIARSITGELCGEKTEIKIIRFEGKILKEKK
jgi:hypothetical protein